MAEGVVAEGARSKAGRMSLGAGAMEGSVIGTSTNGIGVNCAGTLLGGVVTVCKEVEAIVEFRSSAPITWVGMRGDAVRTGGLAAASVGERGGVVLVVAAGGTDGSTAGAMVGCGVATVVIADVLSGCASDRDKGELHIEERLDGTRGGG